MEGEQICINGAGDEKKGGIISKEFSQETFEGKLETKGEGGQQSLEGKAHGL